MVSIGMPVARRRGGTVHVASQVSGLVVLARCGNTLVAPKHHGLLGPLCPSCRDIGYADTWPSAPEPGPWRRLA